MNDDVNHLRLLYEKNRLINLNLVEDVDKYIEYSYGLYQLIIESISPKEINKIEISGVSDSYEVKTKSNKTFDVLLSYWNYSNAIDNSNKKEIFAYHKNDKITGDLYKKIKSVFTNSNDYLCMILFKDSLGRTNITGEVGVEIYELFLGIQDAVKDSFIIQKKLQNIKVICIRVSKSEPKRISLYKRLISKNIGNIFPYSYIDKTTEADKNMDVLIFTRIEL